MDDGLVWARRDAGRRLVTSSRVALLSCLTALLVSLPIPARAEHFCGLAEMDSSDLGKCGSGGELTVCRDYCVAGSSLHLSARGAAQVTEDGLQGSVGADLVPPFAAGMLAPSVDVSLQGDVRLGVTVRLPLASGLAVGPRVDWSNVGPDSSTVASLRLDTSMKLFGADILARLAIYAEAGVYFGDEVEVPFATVGLGLWSPALYPRARSE